MALNLDLAGRKKVAHGGSSNQDFCSRRRTDGGPEQEIICRLRLLATTLKSARHSTTTITDGRFNPQEEVRLTNDHHGDGTTPTAFWKWKILVCNLVCARVINELLYCPLRRNSSTVGSWLATVATRRVKSSHFY
jgi:hypothetical protein